MSTDNPFYPLLIRASIIISLLPFNGCIEEKISIPTTGTVTLQLHGLNGALNGYDPDILYFKQKEDGTYVFTMSGKTSWGGDAPMTHDWSTKYVTVNMDQDGAITSSKELDYPFTNGVFGYFDQLFSAGTHPLGGFEIPRLHSAEGSSLTYSVERLGNIVTFNLDPETGEATGFTSDVIEPAYSGTPKGTFRTSDGGYMTITEKINDNVNPPDHFLTYAKFSSGGSLEFNYDYPIVDNSTYSDLVLEKAGEYYFLNVNPGGIEGATFQYKNSETTKLEALLTVTPGCENAPAIGSFEADFEAEIRFGPGRSQKAHRFVNHDDLKCGLPSNVTGQYQDYTEVPFEVWDITNNRQLMAGFVDRGEDGVFNLIEKKMCICWDPTNCPSVGCCFTSEEVRSTFQRLAIGAGGVVIAVPIQYTDCGQNSRTSVEIVGSLESKEFISIYDFPYSDMPNSALTNGQLVSFKYSVLPVLTANAIWNPSQIPVSSLVLSPPVPNPPASKLLKVTATGITVVYEQFLNLGLAPVKNTYKVVPFGDGFAILANVSRLYSEDEIQPSILSLFDTNLQQTDKPSISENAADNEQLVSNGNAILYSSINNNKLRLVSINSAGGKTSLDVEEDLTSFPIEGYKTTSTKNGGWAVLVWAKPTATTRDLLFLEFDANLNLVKR